MSKRAYQRTANKQALDQPPDNKPAKHKPPSWWRLLMRLLILITLILSVIWLLLAIWYQFGALSAITWLATVIIVGLLAALITLRYLPSLMNKLAYKLINKPALTVNNRHRWSKVLLAGYSSIWLIGLGWFFSIEAKQERNWQADVSEVVSYTRDADNPNLITFTNVRNFDWYAPRGDGEEITSNARWETRTVDMSKLAGVDIFNSYWMGPLIAHTLVSFRFEDDRPLAFSFEIRKEGDETFSALAGFFRRFELSLIAAEERDIIYTRTNVRGEQVYLFPVSHLQQSEVHSLFESYLVAADELNAQPSWYNTLTSNCTNIIFYMARIVSGERLPWDYRIWVSGWLPNYLYNIGMLDANAGTDASAEQNNEPKSAEPWSMEMWYERAHINPKVIGFDNTVASDPSHNNTEFSKQIRQGIPIPPLADTQIEAEAEALSQAK
ncbi:MAG: DUF4105 domain-containing protein, partial [Psychrobacter sp.]|nr:DUF4105 domain-containing protein [Psychrobacter sp.]